MAYSARAFAAAVGAVLLAAPWAASAREAGPIYLSANVVDETVSLAAVAESPSAVAIASTESAAARVTVSRAADSTGTATFFSRSRQAGFAGTISFSSRKVPGGAVFAAAIPSRVPSLGGFVGNGGVPAGMPLATGAISSGFGLRMHPILGIWRAHDGIDLAAPMGTPVTATSDGIVSEADWRGGYGLMVALSHSADLMTRYGHLSRLNVHAGQQVRKGEVIGYVGSTGESTGPHLHYEVRYQGLAVNPASYAARR